MINLLGNSRSIISRFFGFLAADAVYFGIIQSGVVISLMLMSFDLFVAMQLLFLYFVMQPNAIARKMFLGLHSK